MAKQAASSLAEFYTDPGSPYAAFPQEHRSGGSMPLNLMRVTQDAHEITDPAVKEAVLVLCIDSDMPFRWNVGEGWTDEGRMRAGDFNLIPPNTAASYQCGAQHEVLNFALASEALAHILNDHRVGSLSSFEALTSATLFRDETLRRIAMQMWAESAKSGGTSDLLMDGLTQVLIARLLDKAGALRRQQPTLPLSQAELTRLDRVIDAQLAERLTVEDLARVLDMPRWTFADAFKATTGDTPHSYVTTKRIDRACDLLRLSDMPLAEIAYATGFASQSHMTDTFRRSLGTTPGKWRKEVRQ